MSLHTFHRQCPRKQLLPRHASTLSEAELPQAKKVLHLYAQGHFGSVCLFETL